MESWGDTQRIEVPEQVSGRADKVLAQLVSGVSRTRIQQSFDAGRVWRDGQKIAKRERVGPRDLIEVQLIESFESKLEPVELPLNILFEDEHLLFVDKEPGMVVHPGVGTGSETLVHALLHYCEESFGQVGSVGRPGIVHRLDKETSGVMVVAKTQEAYLGLVQQFSERSLRKSYLALVTGKLKMPSGDYSLPIGRHPVHRHKMTILPSGKDAVTEWEVLDRISHEFSLVQCRILTGRTHQIRVHFGDSGYPLAGDTTYGYKPAKFPELQPPRVMLHALSLGIRHPLTGDSLEVDASFPEDFSNFIVEVAEAGRRQSES